MKKILNLLNISKQALNVNIRELMKNDLITEVRDEKDKRIKILKLTTKGNKLNNEINEEQKNKIDALFKQADGSWEKVMIELSNEYKNGLNK
ncbi:winged helix DNA-binding protein [Apilactobacillus apisilvae]|uniref:Winged helix DNA-binding protein n=2 Tax=Apilactobacillus apisilvae TaxID=2923364 RepID=A0ABY4PG68_9LACO|nr:winged helix DNA-binding protein [Apilactobacillus apisilvae]